MKHMRRAVGYCMSSEDCDDYGKGVFLLNHGDYFECVRCRIPGYIEKEKSHSQSNNPYYKEVRVEWDYCVLERRYKATAIVRDESAPRDGNIYILYSPLIRTEKRALTVAESRMAQLDKLNGVPDVDEDIRMEPVLLSFDETIDAFRKSLAEVHAMWQRSARREG